MNTLSHRRRLLCPVGATLVGLAALGGCGSPSSKVESTRQPESWAWWDPCARLTTCAACIADVADGCGWADSDYGLPGFCAMKDESDDERRWDETCGASDAGGGGSVDAGNNAPRCVSYPAPNPDDCAAGPLCLGPEVDTVNFCRPTYTTGVLCGWTDGSELTSKVAASCMPEHYGESPSNGNLDIWCCPPGFRP